MTVDAFFVLDIYLYMNNWKRTFLFIWTGQLFSTLSSSIVGFAVTFWLSIQTGSAQVLAYAMIATLLPQILLGLFTGVFVDRWKRKLTMICSDSFIALCTALLCILFYWGEVEVWHIYIILALRSIGSAFHMPAMQASVPLLVPEDKYMRVAGVNQVIYSISTIAGPALGALFINIMDMTHILFLDIIGAGIACISLLFVTIPNPEKQKKDDNTNILDEIKIGLRAIFHKKGMAQLFVCDVVSMFFIIPVSALFPLITIQHFMGGAYEMSVVEVAWGIGMLLGGIAIGLKQVSKLNRVLLISATCIIDGVGFLLTGFLPSTAFIIFVILMAICGIAAAMWNSAFTVVLQTTIEASTLGRAFATYDSLMLLPSIPGLLATGFIAEQIGITNSFVIAGIGITIVGIIISCLPEIRRLDSRV